jgi:hypothetical protein
MEGNGGVLTGRHVGELSLSIPQVNRLPVNNGAILPQDCQEGNSFYRSHGILVLVANCNKNV